MKTVSPDGYLRLKARELNQVPLRHLISNVDDGSRVEEAGGCAETTLSGYTEWISPVEPSLSIGWDWEWRTLPGKSGAVRLGLPRTNVLLVSETSEPFPWEDSLQLLANYIDAIEWQGVAVNSAFRSGTNSTYNN